MIGTSESVRVAAARTQAHDRLHRQRGLLRPLGVAVTAVVVAGAVAGSPAAGLHGRGLGVTLSLALWAAALGTLVRGAASPRRDVLGVCALAAAGTALAALQPHAATGLAGLVAVWFAVARLASPAGPAIAAGTTAALALALALAGAGRGAVGALVVVSVLLGAVARLLQEARAGQARTELLLAELEDAREEQLAAAALAERGRIAAELHDILAHALSAAAIQLQAARLLGEREHASGDLRASVDRATELVRAGLANARDAVGALRGDALPGVAQLPDLVATLRDDLGVAVTFERHGEERPVGAEAGVALHRAVQEALTNAARHAPGARVRVTLRYEPAWVGLHVRNDRAAGSGELHEAGGGHGLRGLAERVERVGGTARAGRDRDGWLVEVRVPV